MKNISHNANQKMSRSTYRKLHNENMLLETFCKERAKNSMLNTYYKIHFEMYML